MSAIFRWNGEYFGFLSGESVFRADGEYVGWIESDGTAWKPDGSYLGELVENNYILRNRTQIEPIPRIARIHPIRPIPPIPAISRIGKIGRIGWDDALDGL